MLEYIRQVAVTQFKSTNDGYFAAIDVSGPAAGMSVTGECWVEGNYLILSFDSGGSSRARILSDTSFEINGSTYNRRGSNAIDSSTNNLLDIFSSFF